MSLIVTIYVNEGIVMASDSRLTLIVPKAQNGILASKNIIPFSDSAHKTFICPNGCGISTCGNAQYNGKPIAGYIEQFITYLDKETQVSNMPKMIIDYFNMLDNKVETIFQICGYEKNNDSYEQKIFKVVTGPNYRVENYSNTNVQGALWDGETVVLSKLLKEQILAPKIISAENVELSNPNDGTKYTIKKAAIINYDEMCLQPEALIDWNIMSLQDAVDFARFAIETTINAMRFQSINKTVGGPIDILIIKPTKTWWLQHKELK